MTEIDLFTTDEGLRLGSQNEQFKIEWKGDPLPWNDELKYQVQEIFENCDMLLFAVHMLSLNDQREVKRLGVKYTLKDILPVKKDNHSFLKVSLMVHKMDEPSCVSGDEFKIPKSELMYKEVIDIEEEIDFEILDEADYLNIHLKVRDSQKIHLLAVHFLLRVISVICENLNFFIPPDNDYAKSFVFLPKMEVRGHLERRASIIIKDLVQEKLDFETLPEWIIETYKYELHLLGMLPCSFENLVKHKLSELESIIEPEMLSAEIKKQIRVECPQKNISSTFYRLQECKRNIKSSSM